VRGINAILATLKTVTGAPIILGQRLRAGACSSPHGATRLIGDALATLRHLPGMKVARILFRADSAFYTFAAILATGWTPIKDTHAICDDDTRTWIAHAEVAEIACTAFTSRAKKDHIVGRLVVRRIPELNKKDLAHPTLFDTHRFHAFFTTTDLDTVTADQVHRRHAIIDYADVIQTSA
jgi:hypothetical protein